VRALSVEGRLTLCNMTIEAGARIGIVAPDEKTIAYLRQRLGAMPAEDLERACTRWRSVADDGAGAAGPHTGRVEFDAAAVEPRSTWGTTPADSSPLHGRVGDPDAAASEAERERLAAGLRYMGLRAGTPLSEVPIDVAFIGSCTNGRIEDLRAAAEVLAGHRMAKGVRGLVVPGSGLVKRQAEDEGLAKIFVDAGFEWREPGCSMCIGMNGDRLESGERCASTSNRNFENRQGPGGRTHLMSPASVAASAVRGRLTDPREVLA
jgi:3-isopropylmalate/(R)-2-methylmalate dehydratase large subunit